MKVRTEKSRQKAWSLNADVEIKGPIYVILRSLAGFVHTEREHLLIYKIDPGLPIRRVGNRVTKVHDGPSPGAGKNIEGREGRIKALGYRYYGFFG